MAWFSPDEARFLQKCERSKQGCWIWLGYKMPSGYGTFRYEGRKAMATHAALEFDGRQRPSPEHFALHSCDNPCCVNPDHLRWGLQQENVDDMCQRKRLNQSGLKKWRNTKTREKWSHCKRGHPLEGDNVSIEKNGQRLCVACKRIRYQARLECSQRERISMRIDLGRDVTPPGATASGSGQETRTNSITASPFGREVRGPGEGS